MKILVVGSGGREHAIIRALKKSPKAETIYALIDHSVSTGLQHQNTANRQKAHLMKLVYSLEVSAKAAE